MEIRQLHAEEFEASLSLSEYAFQYKVAGNQRAENKLKFKPERVWGIFEDGTLGAKLTLLPLEVYIQGRAVPMGGIAGVATWPENRRQGLVAKLLKHTLQTMNETGQTISLLHPFLIPFYRKFGWEVYCEYKKYSIPASNFPLKIEIPGKIKRDSSDMKDLEQLYDQFAMRYNGTLKRDQKWWRDSVLDEETHYAVYYTEHGEPEGYVLYKIEKSELIIDEFVHLNENALRGLWTFLANHDSMVSKASLKLVPSDDMLPFLLPDPRIPQENYPYFMARIVNAEAFVKEFSFVPPGGDQEITLYIEDEHAPWNDGLWRWTVDEQGKAAFTAMEGEKDQADLVCGIGTFTVLLLGYKRPEEMAYCGRLNGKPEAVKLMEAILPQEKTALFDFF